MIEHYIHVFVQWDGLFSVYIKGSMYSSISFPFDEKNLTPEEVGQLMGGN